MNGKITNINAGFKIRLFAFIMDAIIVALPSILAAILLLFIFKPSQNASAAIIFLTPLGLAIVYFALLTMKGQSLGQKYFGITVLTNEANLSFGKSLLRSFLKVFFGWIFWLPVPGSVKKSAVHDMICKTQVFYVNENYVLKSDSKERLISFLQKSFFAAPIVTLLIFIFFLIVKIAVKGTALVSGNILVYLIYLFIPVAFYSSLLGITVSFQSVKAGLYPKKFGIVFTIINTLFLVIFCVVILKAYCSI